MEGKSLIELDEEIDEIYQSIQSKVKEIGRLQKKIAKENKQLLELVSEVNKRGWRVTHIEDDGYITMVCTERENGA